MFSTPDSDNDQCAGGCSCAAVYGNGWWFDSCTAAGLNYDITSIWVTSGAVYDVQATHMLVKVD